MRLSVCAAVLAISPVALCQLTVVALDPTLNASNREPNTSIRVDFDRAVAPASLAAFKVYGSISGPIGGALTLENGDTRVRFDPLRAFAAGELVQVVMAETLQAQDASFLRTQGYVTSFRVKAASAPMTFTQIQLWDVDATIFARVYGAQPADLDDDDYPDLALICENSSDVRVSMNRDDATGTFAPMLTPTNGTGATPSPNENADMNADGFIDIVTCNIGGSSVSVLRGNGDGTFQAALTYSMGNDPRGIALLDVDGDGDFDVCTANSGSDNLALRRNNGDGTLGAMTTFDGNVSGEWGLQAADMNGDGIVDLVTGGQWSSEVAVLLSNGDGTFQTPIVRFAGGAVWMVACGDLNGDGKIDLTTANGSTGNGSKLLGNGNGTLQTATTHSAGGFSTATDIGDLDGDGDLDWVLSSYGGGQWRIYRNNGAGTFTLQQTIFATSNPACAVLFDIDLDRDLDLALLDEIADTCKIYENGALDQQTYCYGGGTCPCGNAGETGHGCENSFGTGGALLVAQGKASVLTDQLVLNASGLQPSASMIFFQGSAQQNGGAGSPFGDGLRCVAAPTLRFPIKTSVNGFVSYGYGLGDPPVSIQGQVPAVGGTFYYQAWYRNPDAFCMSGTSNLTNGLRVTWTP